MLSTGTSELVRLVRQSGIGVKGNEIIATGLRSYSLILSRVSPA
jgi:hypothetical protein